MDSQFYHIKESVDQYISMAEGYDGSFLIAHLIKFLPAHSSILEIGSGPGKDIALLAERYIVTGSDYSLEFLERLKLKFPDTKLLHLNAASIVTDEKFDAIYSNKVLHHLTNEELSYSLLRQYDILNEGGILCHSFWKGEGEETYDGMYVNNHTIGGLERMFASGFDILKMIVYKEMEDGDSILVIAQKIKAAS